MESLNTNSSDAEQRDYLLYSFQRKRIELITKPYVLHAEANAITKLARSSQSSEGATLYCTDMPCMECSKLIIQARIARVVYERPYRIDDGVRILERAGVEVVNIPTDVINHFVRKVEE